MTPGGAAPRTGGRHSIGEVLRRLRPDFPDVSISKIRFLEAEGLIDPERTASGYRKFSSADVERLRYVLAAQRDHYLPLRVIREHLDAMARGLEPPARAGDAPRAPRPATAQSATPDRPAAPNLRLSRSELLANSGLSEDQLTSLEAYGLLASRPGTVHYDAPALTIATTVAALSAHGLEPRHLRFFKTAADREVGLVEQVVAPIARRRDSGAAARAEQLRAELADLSTQLHAALVAAALSSDSEPLPGVSREVG